jgi:hypothetical protein
VVSQHKKSNQIKSQENDQIRPLIADGGLLETPIAMPMVSKATKNVPMVCPYHAHMIPNKYPVISALLRKENSREATSC